MKRISYAVMSTLTALVLLFGYRTSTSSSTTSSGMVAIGASAPTTASSTGSGQTTSGASSPPTGTSSPSSTTGSTPSAPTAAKTVTGTAAQTRYGPVQVQITVQDEKVTNVSVVEYPNNNGRDQEINSSALSNSGQRNRQNADRQDRHGLRRHVHQPGLPHLAAERARPGGTVTCLRPT